MKISISNIAWQIQEEESIANLMHKFGVGGVEIAPTKIWSSPLSATDAEIAEYRNFWHDRGIQIVSMQALLYGRPDLTVFGSAEKRRETIEYLSGIIQLGEKLGVNVLVFGSPKNRRVENITLQKERETAFQFFFEVGEMAIKHGVTFCIEPNPIIYSCNFINTSAEGLKLVKAVGSEGFGLHLDAAGMTLSEETIEPAIAKAVSHLCHFHISEPYLAPIGSGVVKHDRFAKALRKSNYKGWTSIEMKAQNADSNFENVEKAFKIALQNYGEG